ncbi:hypothetical protein [Nocardia sp. NPDC058666]|uniref:hypothetical protein n=1 Tax=Nocardia sp. NPDC058666 TaxID=3346587 RepID=UPI003667B996
MADNSRPSTRRGSALWLAIAVAAMSMVATGCMSADNHSQKCETTAKLETKEFERETRAAIDKADTLPPGYCLYNVSINKNDTEGVLGVNIYLAVADSKGRLDDLRPAATAIAHVVKKVPYDFPVADLYVSNLTPENSSKNYAGILAEEFHTRPWDGSPSHEAELASWVPWYAVPQ